MPLRSFRQIFLPYCIKRQADGTWSVLNRECVSLGDDERKDHSIPMRSYRLRGLGPEALKKIAHTTSEDGTEFWLYDDSCTPDSSALNWQAYQKRLMALTKFEKRADPDDRKA